MKMNWTKIKNSNWVSFILGEEPECIHILKHRNDEYIVVYNDAYDLTTGKSELLNSQDILSKFNIKIEDYHGL